ncbi:MAG: Hsp70 family protein [Parachlamydiaceae bacterium]|nr:Hsp70 family protein [Parachlamydiaceae bacterium]
MENASYIIGIDLGTTNCTMAYLPKQIEENASPSINQFSISQIMGTFEFGESLSFPSFIYFPLNEEQEKLASIPWKKEKSFVVGTYARDRGAELPNRLIHSAKSWLCYPGIDRREKILPTEADETDLRMSPMESCAELLRHLREAWDFQMPSAPFVNQTLLITVPASFDPSARQLIQEAAVMAGYPEIILLEEPQAAFYSWIYLHQDQWRKELSVGDSVLVIDIGGGTTDFSLISVQEEDGNLHLKREAVGSHLLLGGDNIDLTLAYLVKGKLEDQGVHLDSWQLQTLVHQCRQAKETLFDQPNLGSVDLTIMGRGSKLFANTIQTSLTREELNQCILNGFLPIVGPEERSPVEQQSGFKQIGLPYAKDPRISCQLAKFLSMTGQGDDGRMDQFVLPTAVLFNGGTLKAVPIRNQILSLLNQWAKQLNKPQIKELSGADYDYAVSRGAAYYGRSRLGEGIRIRAGTSCSYYIGIEEAMPAVPGMSPPLRAICVAPFGLEEGEERILDNQEFALSLGEMATFRFFSNSAPKLLNGETALVGSMIRNWKQELKELDPIETVLDKKEGDGKSVRVKLKSKVTELGVLELWCEALDGRKWKLEFNLRN